MAALQRGPEEVELVDPADDEAMAAFRSGVVDVAAAMRRAADAGDGPDARLELARAPTAVRPPRGAVRRRRLEPAWSSGCVSRAHRRDDYDEWYAGRPVLVTANDYDQRLNNGDMGVTVRATGRAPAGRARRGRGS